MLNLVMAVSLMPTAFSTPPPSGLINSGGLVDDGLPRDCHNNDEMVWSYNQAPRVGGLVEVWRATGDTGFLDTARCLADAAIASPQLTRDGVFAESCDVGQSSCDDNQKQFKGIFMRYFAYLTRATNSTACQQFARSQSDAVWASDRDALNRIGRRWAGGAPDQLNWCTQASRLGALV